MRHQPHRGDGHRDDTAGVGHQTHGAQLRLVLVFDFGEVDAFGTIPIRLVPGRSRCYGRRIAVRPEWKVPLDLIIRVRLVRPFRRCSDHPRTLSCSSFEDRVFSRVRFEPSGVLLLRCDIL